MRVLIACEYSGVSRTAFERLGHSVLSCDLLPADDGAPNHYQGDVFDLIGKEHFDLMLAHPPCTYLCSSGIQANSRNPDRWTKTEEALDFFRRLLEAPIEKIAIENPVGLASRIRPPDQIIQPWQFGENASKATCLWLKNLPKLVPTHFVPPRMVDGRMRWGNQSPSGSDRTPPGPDRWKIRSRTYPGIAQAWAAQWSKDDHCQLNLFVA